MSAAQESPLDRLADDTPRQPDAGTAGVRHVVRRFRGPLLVLLLTALLAATGGWFLTQSLRARHDGANQALVDRGATNRVIGAVSDGLDRIFSYSYTDTEATRRAAGAVLTGRAAGQYDTLFGQVRQHAAAQKLTLTSRVIAAGVTRLDGGNARLLVFLDQTATRGDTGQTSTAAAQLSITARLVDGHWLIADMHAR